MKNLLRICVMTVMIVCSMTTNAFAQNSGNRAILDDLNRLAEEIKEDIAESQANAGTELTEHDSDIKSAIDALEDNTALAHDNLAADHDALGSKLDQLMDSGPDCPTAWGRTLDGPERFELVMGGEAVLDLETCLVWEQAPQAGTEEWEIAQASCFTKKVGGRNGWRLPTIDELATLPQSEIFGQRLPLDHPFDTIQRNIYWSSTKVVTSNTVNNEVDPIWVVDFTVDGHVSLAGRLQEPGPSQPNYYNYWCVRGASGI